MTQLAAPLRAHPAPRPHGARATAGIRVERLTKRFGDFTAVEEVSFRVDTGELVALLGPSGGGKSTILRIVAGLEQADAGSVWLGDEVVDRVPARGRRVGFVFQHYALFRHMTVADNIAFGLRVQGVPRAERAQRVAELLGITGLRGLEHRYPTQISGGQRQRVALARALAPRPRLLLLDEPFAAADARVREELRTWLRRLHDEVGVTSIFVTHDQEEAFALADRVVIIQGGRLQQAGTPQEILENPASEFVARFIGDVNVLEGAVQEGVARIGALRLPVPDTDVVGPARLVVRSYDLALRRADDGVATVRRLVPLGDRVRVEAALDDGAGLVVQLPRGSAALEGLAPGARVAVSARRLRVYPADAIDA